MDGTGHLPTALTPPCPGLSSAEVSRKSLRVQAVPRPPSQALPTWVRLTPWVVAAVALAPRLAVLYGIQTSPLADTLLGDSEGYFLWAQSIAAGDWLGSGVFYQAPLYPYFLASILVFAGKNLLVIRLIQVALGAWACGLLARAGTRLFSARVGLGAGLLLALYPSAWYFDVLLQKSSLDGFLMTVVLCAVAAVLSQPSGRRWALLGAAIAALALTRENALALAPVMLGWLLWLHRDATWPARLRLSGALVLGTAVVLAPVAVRNLAVGGGLHLTTSQLGPNLYIGNNKVANGRYVPLQSGRGSWRFEREDAHRLAEQALGRTLSDREVSRYWVGRTIEFVRAHPGKELALLLDKLLLALNRTEVGDTDSQYLFADHSRALGWARASSTSGSCCRLPGCACSPGAGTRTPFFRSS